MKIIYLTLFLFVTISPLGAIESDITFNNEVFLQAYSTTKEGVKLTEYIREKENLENWSQMVSLQVHSDASRISDVMNPYAEARKHLYIKDSKIYVKSTDLNNEDAIFEFILISPDNSFVELAFVRAVSKEGTPVVLFVFSKKILITEQSETTNLINEALTERKNWFPALGKMSFTEAINMTSKN